MSELILDIVDVKDLLEVSEKLPKTRSETLITQILETCLPQAGITQIVSSDI